jgi:hypothetical protein
MKREHEPRQDIAAARVGASKIRQMNPNDDTFDETTETEDFVAASAPAFAAVWDNPEDAAYDAL